MGEPSVDQAQEGHVAWAPRRLKNRLDLLDRVGMGAFGLPLDPGHLREELGRVPPQGGLIKEADRIDRDVDRRAGELTLPD